MKKNQLWAGIDVGVETASVCVTDSAGEVLHHSACRSRIPDLRHELVRFRRPRYAGVHMEAGTGAHLARGLRDLGYPVQLFETRQLSKFLRARRHKTDAGDAQGIADAGRIHPSALSKVHLKSIDNQKILSRLTIRKQLIRQRVATQNLLCRQIELYGGRLSCRVENSQFDAAVRRELRVISCDRNDELVRELRFLSERCQELAASHNAIGGDLKRAASENEVCRRFMEIPGVGPLCALAFYAAVDDPARFRRTVSVGSYFGLAPRLHTSGLTSRKSRISKMGNRAVRCLLVNSARMFLIHCPKNSALRDWAIRLEHRAGRGPARIALARKLSLIMLAMWKNGTHFIPHVIEPATEGPETVMEPVNLPKGRSATAFEPDRESQCAIVPAD